MHRFRVIVHEPTNTTPHEFGRRTSCTDCKTERPQRGELALAQYLASTIPLALVWNSTSLTSTLTKVSKRHSSCANDKRLGQKAAPIDYELSFDPFRGMACGCCLVEIAKIVQTLSLSPQG